MNVIQDVHVEGIPVADIRQALNHEWGLLSSHVQEQTGSPPLRATTSTLVVMTQAGAALQRARETLHQLASAVPSRAILFIIDENRTTPIANVWAHCSIGARGKHGACYDVIEVEMPRDRVEAIPNIIAVHRLGELPTFVVWNGPADIESMEFRKIGLLADRIIIDTERFNQPLAALRRYAMFLGTAGASVIGSDLAWTRLSTWRELVAQSFDPANMQHFGDDIRTLDLTYDDSQVSGAILLASWIISRLGLRPESASDSPSTLRLLARDERTGRQLTVNLHHSQRTGVGLRSARILARTGTEYARISILRDDHGKSVHRIDSAGMPRQERVVHHPDPPRGELIAAELTRHTRDRVFEEALACGAQFQRILEGGQK